MGCVMIFCTRVDDMAGRLTVEGAATGWVEGRGEATPWRRWAQTTREISFPTPPEGGAAVKKEGQALGRERGKGKVAESALVWL